MFIIQYICNISFLAPLVQKVITLANQWMKLYPKDNIIIIGFPITTYPLDSDLSIE